MRRNERIENRQGLLVVANPGVYVDGPYSNVGAYSDLEAEQVPAKHHEAYEGFDGEFWPGNDDETLMDRGLLPLAEIHRATAIFRTAHSYPRCRLLYCELVGGGAPQRPTIPTGFAFAGYDYGILESAWNYFSCVLNEIICRLAPDDLIAFSSLLNGSLLFESLEDVREYAQTRAHLVSLRIEGLETFDEDDKLVPIAIYVNRTVIPE